MLDEPRFEFTDAGQFWLRPLAERLIGKHTDWVFQAIVDLCSAGYICDTHGQCFVRKRARFYLPLFKGCDCWDWIEMDWQLETRENHLRWLLGTMMHRMRSYDCWHCREKKGSQCPTKPKSSNLRSQRPSRRNRRLRGSDGHRA